MSSINKRIEEEITKSFMSLAHPLPMPYLPDNMMVEETIHDALYARPNPVGPGRLAPSRWLRTDSTDYLVKLMSRPDEFQATLERAFQALAPIANTFQAIAFTGNSGAMFGPALVLRLNKQMILVRKYGESSHSSRSVEGVAEPCDYIFVDDLVSSGETISRVVETIESRRATSGSRLRAVYLYNTSSLISTPGRYVGGGVSIYNEKTTAPVEEIAL